MNTEDSTRIEKANRHFDMANSYEKGINVDYQNYDLALKHYKIAANLGHVEALCCIGIMYQFGKGVSKNIELALEYYYEAKSKGSANAVFLLGSCYYDGIGFEKDIVKGTQLRREAYINGSPMAEKWFLENTGQIN